MSSARGIVDIHLSADEPTMTFWNDPETKRDAWGTITFVQLIHECIAVVRFGDQTLRARPGRTFPRTGLFLVDADPADQTIWIRSRWTHHVMEVLPDLDPAFDR